MDNVITKILDVERKAREVIDDARKANDTLEKRLKKDSKNLGDDIERRVNAKNLALENFEESEADKKIEVIENELETKLEELENRYNKNKDRWIKNLTENIIGK